MASAGFRHKTALRQIEKRFGKARSSQCRRSGFSADRFAVGQGARFGFGGLLAEVQMGDATPGGDQPGSVLQAFFQAFFHGAPAGRGG